MNVNIVRDSEHFSGVVTTKYELAIIQERCNNDAIVPIRSLNFICVLFFLFGFFDVHTPNKMRRKNKILKKDRRD